MIRILRNKTTVYTGVIIGSKNGVVTMELITNPTVVNPSVYDGNFVIYLAEV